MAKVEVKENSKVHEQFLLILDAFRRMLYNAENSAERLEVFDDIITLRASFLIDSVLEGLRAYSQSHCDKMNADSKPAKCTSASR